MEALKKLKEIMYRELYEIAMSGKFDVNALDVVGKVVDAIKDIDKIMGMETVESSSPRAIRDEREEHNMLYDTLEGMTADNRLTLDEKSALRKAVEMLRG